MTITKYDILDPDFQMEEKTLADRVWNLLWREGGFEAAWLTMHFSNPEEDVWDAVDELVEEGRAYFTPARRKVKPVWTFPDMRH